MIQIVRRVFIEPKASLLRASNSLSFIVVPAKAGSIPSSHLSGTDALTPIWLSGLPRPLTVVASTNSRVADLQAGERPHAVSCKGFRPLIHPLKWVDASKRLSSSYTWVLPFGSLVLLRRSIMKTPQSLRKLLLCSLFGLSAVAAWSFAMADDMGAPKTVMVGGAAMYPTKNIVQNAVNSKDHTTLVAAVKAAGLVDTLSGPGPFTVFAPTNEAFAALPAGTVDTLVKPENKAALTKILTYHVVPGRLTAHDLAAKVAAGGGKAELTTVEGENLTVRKDGDQWAVTDAKGNTAHVTIGDVIQSNGVIHVIDKVLMP